MICNPDPLSGFGPLSESSIGIILVVMDHDLPYLDADNFSRDQINNFCIMSLIP